MKAALLICLFAAVLPFELAYASKVIEKGSNNEKVSRGKTHTLEIRCDAGLNAIKISRVSVLDVPSAKSAKLDFGLTTAHGLLDEAGLPLSNCRIKDFEGQEYKLNTFKAPNNYKPGTPTDWALVAFARARNTDIVRYTLASPLGTENYDNLGENKLPLIFSSARGLPDGEQRCYALPRRFIGMNKPQYVGLLPHDCRAIAGQSGAPLSVTRQGRNVIIGFHVGNAFWMGIPDIAQPAKHGYMRVVDDQLMSEINDNVTKILDIP